MVEQPGANGDGKCLTDGIEVSAEFFGCEYSADLARELAFTGGHVLAVGDNHAHGCTGWQPVPKDDEASMISGITKGSVVRATAHTPRAESRSMANGAVKMFSRGLIFFTGGASSVS